MIRFREAGVLFFLLLLIAATTARAHNFIAPSNLRNILLDVPMLMVIAMGMTMIILSRNIDLSVGSTLGCSAIVVGTIFKHNPNFPLLAGAVIGILVGLLLGAINGLLVTWLRVPAIIATLGTLNVYRGLIFLVGGGVQVNNNDIPQSLLDLSQVPFQLPWIVMIAFGVVAATHYFLRYTRTGREMYAIGGNPIAARLRGIPVDRTVFLAFMLTGGLSGLAGIMATSRLGVVNPGTIGLGFELEVIAATIIGGTNIFGGSGSALGTFLGCLLLGFINNALIAAGFSEFWQLAIYGFIILVAVTVDAMIRRQLERLAGDTVR